MRAENSNARFWTMVGALNVIALSYPAKLLLRADSADESLVAAFTFIGTIFLVVVLDAVIIILRDTPVTVNAKAKRSATEDTPLR